MREWLALQLQQQFIHAAADCSLHGWYGRQPAQHRQQQESAIRRANQRLQGLHTIDQALLSHQPIEQSPLLTALRHINALVPCERLTIFRFHEATGLAVAEYRLAESMLEVKPGLAFSSHFITDMLQLSSHVR